MNFLKEEPVNQGLPPPQAQTENRTQFSHFAMPRWPAISRSDPGGHQTVLPFDWLTGEQTIFVNYYDYAASPRFWNCFVSIVLTYP